MTTHAFPTAQRRVEYPCLAATLRGHRDIEWHPVDDWLGSCAYPQIRLIHAPVPDTLCNLYVHTHECAHVILKHFSIWPDPCKVEREAWAWTIRQFRKWGLWTPLLLDFSRVCASGVDRLPTAPTAYKLKIRKFVGNYHTSSVDEVRRILQPIKDFLG